MNDLFLDSKASSQPVKIPKLLKNLQSTVAALIDEQGFLIDCNLGFLFLVNQTDIPQQNWNVRDYFIQPVFSDFLNVHSNDLELPVYQGIMNVGEINISCRSINAAVYRYSGGLLLIGEHDIADLEKLSASVVELNNELAQSQRDLVKANRNLKRKEAKIEEMLLTDSMTGIPNRRHFEKRSEEELKRHQRLVQPLCLAMGDIDLFKQVNDTYGHDVGDEVICGFANVMNSSKRATDFVARVGGEEFIFLLPHTDLLQAQIVVDRIREVFSQQIYDSIDQPITASFGITELQPGDTIQDMVKRSDLCLYEAKKNGRNRVVSKAC
ncbi:GGDEF domain-containing protein [Aliikangiella sp. IMCC44653]